jgi:hypothetical protein
MNQHDISQTSGNQFNFLVYSSSLKFANRDTATIKLTMLNLEVGNDLFSCIATC